MRRSRASAASHTEPTPERTAFVRFRPVLIAHGLDRVAFETIAAEATTGTLVDATIIASASEADGNGR